MEKEITKVVFTNDIQGEVQLFSDGRKAGKMDVAIKGERLAVLHTEVGQEFEGRGFAKLLLDQLVAHARENNLKIIPLCSYVQVQFKRHPADYEDVWSKDV